MSDSDRMTINVTFEQLAPLVNATIHDGYMTVGPNHDPQPMPLKLGDMDLGTWIFEHVEAVYGAPDDHGVHTHFQTTFRKVT